MVAFAFCHLLGFKLMPRFKNIGSQKLYRPEKEKTLLFYHHVNPYGTFERNMDMRIPIKMRVS